MFGLGPWEIGLIFVAILLVLGPTRLPEVARSLAKGVKEFRKAAQEGDDDAPAEVPARTEVPTTEAAARTDTTDGPETTARSDASPSAETAQPTRTV